MRLLRQHGEQMGQERRLVLFHAGVSDANRNVQTEEPLTSIHEEMARHRPGFFMCSVPEISIKGKEVQARAVLLNTTLKKLCANAGVKFVNLSKTLEEEGSLARDGIHFRAETGRRVADKLAEHMRPFFRARVEAERARWQAQRPAETHAGERGGCPLLATYWVGKGSAPPICKPSNSGTPLEQSGCVELLGKQLNETASAPEDSRRADAQNGLQQPATTSCFSAVSTELSTISAPQPKYQHRPFPHCGKLGSPTSDSANFSLAPVKCARKVCPRPRRKKQNVFRVACLNLNGALTETHLRDLEEPPTHKDWCWVGNNRSGSNRKGGGVGFLWRRDTQWQGVGRNCMDHMWLTGDIMGTSVAVCVIYMAVSGTRLEANEALIECVASDREILILGDFNGHISELDGYTDPNGNLLLWLAERLQLNIANLDPRCEGKYTGCARGSATSIDYVLVSHRLTRLLNSLHIDEEGNYSAGSDHNRMRIDFSRTQHLKLPRRCNGSEGQMHLSEKAIERVAAEFEDSQQRREANTYEEYIATLRSIMHRHMTRNKNPTRQTRKPWWDKEVAQAWQARREANRAHRRAVKTEDPEVCSHKWKYYLKLKHEMQALIQVKLANANRQMLQELRDEGRSARVSRPPRPSKPNAVTSRKTWRDSTHGAAIAIRSQMSGQTPDAPVVPAPPGPLRKSDNE
ncbi:hypothetical protein HPB50_009948 [Hyalomma asiaticum]|uniref:Uncharacterized protein n=1 Tax=Hyalomma asiaticum TaxID=266040 RepID=A0ACB7TFT7_HYAAI|nr:hypothetical protein HPB50_009948 [Hyalomma asiaticum]